MVYYGVSWTSNLLMVPILVAGAALTALGVGTCLAALKVAYRDFRYVVPFLVQFWMFATPVVYPASLVPREWQWALYLNPMAGVIEGFRSAILGSPFDIPGMLVSFAIAATLFAAGISYFGKSSGGLPTSYEIRERLRDTDRGLVETIRHRGSGTALSHFARSSDTRNCCALQALEERAGTSSRQGNDLGVEQCQLPDRSR
jgi:hypothetical protein